MKIIFIKNNRFDFLESVDRAFQSLEIETLSLFIEDPTFLEKLVAGVIHFQPDFLFTIPIAINLSSFAHALKRPIVHWELDKLLNPQWLNPASYSPYEIIFSTYKEDVAWFEAMGIPAFYLPFAANIQHHGLPPSRSVWNVSFVGRMEQQAHTHYHHFLNSLPHSNPIAQQLETLLNQLITAPLSQQKLRARIAEIAQQFNTTHPETATVQLDPFAVAALLSKEAGRRKRIDHLQAIPDVTLFGPEEWRQLPFKNLNYQREIPQYTHSGAIFHQSRINLSITRPHGMDGLTDRIFNVLFSQGFLLTDQTQDLLELFDDNQDLTTYTSKEEMIDKIQFFLTHETQRHAIARHGEQTIHNRHTFTHRIQTMLTLLKPLLSL